MKRSWLLYIALGVAIFFAITYAIFFYLNIDNNNKWSTFFSFTSTFGIVATICVYWWQKKDSENSEKKRQKEISISYLNIFTAYADELKTIVIQLVKLHNLLDKNNDSFVEYLGGHNIHAFILKNTKGRELGNARMFKFDSSSLSYIYSSSASVNVNISEKYQFLYKHSIQINTYIENLIFKIHYDNSKENILDYFSTLKLGESINKIDLCVKDFEDYCES
ncbi:hypothetical protein [Proteus mirabilis]|uniref:hypothetical protein n=1 Tax=Proteus mirabilis TaxID=584 RepID=UPI00234BBCFA|nr:hypothetical protein [Proteus mirabilis]MDC5888650.1 hypothetical protein [Proteus mirabilis]MDC5906247.1 hypothetical protein [Proteus mirabilis]MDC5909788.1 hypothetical protein [Proteus mirabilis]MDC5923899.1 hypothetical protein [Proteus mirabilis]MDC5934428.1 hypothetical protein [Proteus mirabilis]